MKLITSTKNIDIKQVLVCDIVFEERVRLNCFYCNNYDKKKCCPPNIPVLDYQKVLSEYDNLYLIYHKHNFENEITQADRIISTTILHSFLLDAERILWENNYPMATSFIGGCCKLCGWECNKKLCKFPMRCRIPLEALGMNVIKTMEKIGVNLIFPPKDYFYRIGLLVW